jgi:hypothetical protein
MSVILSLLGIVLAAAGVAAIGFGIPINEFTLGTTLVLAGTTGLAGGLVLIGLAAVVAELGRITEALKTRPVARPAARPPEGVEPVVPAAPSIVAVPTPGIAASVRPSQANIPSQANVPQANVPPRLRHEAPVRDARPIEAGPLASPPSTVDASSNAIERLRSSIPRAERPKPETSLVADHDDVPLSPNGGHHQAQQPMPPSGQSQPEPKVPTDDRAGDAVVDALKASRLDFLFRAKPARPTTSPENFDAFWPSERRVGSLEAEAGPKVEDVQSQPDQAVSVQDPQPESTPPQEPPATGILKSGVVEGMAYTLYADGSIEAELPNGTVRFSSIAELRAHIESNS